MSYDQSCQTMNALIQTPDANKLNAFRSVVVGRVLCAKRVGCLINTHTDVDCGNHVKPPFIVGVLDM